MKNPASLLWQWFKVYRSFARFPNAYSFCDATSHLCYVLQPGRLTEWELCRWVRSHLKITSTHVGDSEITHQGSGLRFLWSGPAHSGLAMAVRQEVDPSNPHNYTTLPIQLFPRSLVLDVGTCEGLFAIRMLTNNLVSRVVCFEPSPHSAELLERSGQRYKILDRMTIERCAVGKTSQDVFFTNSETAEGNHVVHKPTSTTTKVRQVSIDDFCLSQNLELDVKDLIKIDAEGSDLDVLLGAEQRIRKRGPQIAVTTYHNPIHAMVIVEFLKSVQPNYRIRIKGTTVFRPNETPRPVLLQASLVSQTA